MQELRLTEATRSKTRGDSRPLAQYWMEQALAEVNEDGMFRDPELEAEYQEWKKAREAQKKGA